MFLVGLILNVGRRPERHGRARAPQRERARGRNASASALSRDDSAHASPHARPDRRRRHRRPPVPGRRDRRGAARARARRRGHVRRHAARHRGARAARPRLGRSSSSRSRASRPSAPLGAIRGLFRLPRALCRRARDREAVRARRGDRRRRLRLGPGRARGAHARHPDRDLRAELDPGPHEQAARPARPRGLPLVRREPPLLQAEEDRDERQPGAPRSAPEAARRPATGAPRDDACTCSSCGGSQGAVAVNELASDGARRAREGRTARDRAPDRREGSRADDARATPPPASTPTCHAFIKDMAAAYHRADLIIGRAGATTVAELAIAGKPADLHPLPVRRRQPPGAQRARDGRRRAPR